MAGPGRLGSCEHALGIGAETAGDLPDDIPEGIGARCEGALELSATDGSRMYRVGDGRAVRPQSVAMTSTRARWAGSFPVRHGATSCWEMRPSRFSITHERMATPTADGPAGDRRPAGLDIPRLLERVSIPSGRAAVPPCVLLGSTHARRDRWSHGVLRRRCPPGGSWSPGRCRSSWCPSTAHDCRCRPPRWTAGRRCRRHDRAGRRPG